MLHFKYSLRIPLGRRVVRIKNREGDQAGGTNSPQSESSMGNQLWAGVCCMSLCFSLLEDGVIVVLKPDDHQNPLEASKTI